MKMLTLLFILFFATQSSMASSLTDTQRDAVLGVITNFILTDTSTDTPSVSPTFVNESNISIAENNASALTIELNTNKTVTYAITDGNITLFDINSSTGVVTFKTPADYESGIILYTFTVTATDSEGNIFTQEITIHITNLVETAPQLVKPLYLTAFTGSGDAHWTEDNSTFYTGTGSWKNEDIGDSQSACMEASVEVSGTQDTLLYQYKVDTNEYGDYLRF
ncbi:MAG: cadherin repeat domain-containing protein [Sulfurovum sp.]|nr:cadherin repeat domain-containing protein [Sulfurovum sp.]